MSYNVERLELKLKDNKFKGRDPTTVLEFTEEPLRECKNLVINEGQA